MRIENAVVMDAPPQRIYELARDTERWPDYLPHYRYVRVLREEGGEKLIEMAARRGWIPVRWRALQRNDDAMPRIAFRHVGGWTKGMEVEWLFEPQGDRTVVRIVHDLTFHFPVAQRFVERHIVSNFFIHAIANRTLMRFKRLVEAHV